ncbi:MAG: hypothetical protein KAI24_05970 [Planctomycetes bacterium]|nr:hypothetical protein [Planctomycetota bacterium]
MRWSQRRAEAAVAAGKLTAAAAWQAHVDYVQRAFEQLKVLFEAGRVDVQEHDKAAYHLADAKLRAATAGK